MTFSLKRCPRNHVYFWEGHSSTLAVASCKYRFLKYVLKENTISVFLLQNVMFNSMSYLLVLNLQILAENCFYILFFIFFIHQCIIVFVNVWIGFYFYKNSFIPSFLHLLCAIVFFLFVLFKYYYIYIFVCMCVCICVCVYVCSF